MEKIACIVITTGRNRFEEARRRRNRRRVKAAVQAAVQAVRELAVYALVLGILLLFGTGLGVTALVFTGRMGMSMTIAVMGTFTVSGFLTDAVFSEIFRKEK